MDPRTKKFMIAGSIVAVALVGVIVALVLGGGAGPEVTAPVAATPGETTPTASIETTGSIVASETPREASPDGDDDEGDAVAGGQAPSGGTSTGTSGGSTSSGGTTSGGSTTPDTTEDPKPVPVVPVTLTLEQRQACYYDLIAAEDRAVAEASEKYSLDDDPPNISGYVALFIELLEKYQGEVCAEYGITTDQIATIISEGTSNNWPMPPLPS